MRKLSEEERRRRRHNTIVKYRKTEKGQMATRKAALKYYHKTKGIKEKISSNIKSLAFFMFNSPICLKKWNRQR
jgi:hypothetical protein